MMNRTVIVMGRNYASRLGMIRAAGEAGCNVAVIQTDRVCKQRPVDSFSRYITSGYYHVPQPNSKELIELLLSKFAQHNQKCIILPTDDYTASVIDLNINTLKDYFFFPNINMEEGRVVHYMDKGIQKRIAKDVGFSVVKGWSVHKINGEYTIPNDIEYPCFVKPETSYKGANKQSMKKCNNLVEVKQLLSSFAGEDDYSVLIEQYVDIDREYAILGYSGQNGVVVPGVIEMLRGDLGVTAIGKIFPVEEVEGLYCLVSNLMRKLGFFGLFDIDMYEKEGHWYFSELNMRFGASGYAITHSIINLPRLFVESITDATRAMENSIHVSDTTFINEKVMLQLFAKNKISKQEYYNMRKAVDFSLIESNDDPLPYKRFNREEKLVMIKKMVKTIIHLNK